MEDDRLDVKEVGEAVAQLVSCSLGAMGWLGFAALVFFTEVPPVPFFVAWNTFGIGAVINNELSRRVAKRAGFRPFRRWSFLMTAFTKINNPRRLRQAFALARGTPGAVMTFLEEWRWVLAAAVILVAILDAVFWFSMGSRFFSQ